MSLMTSRLFSNLPSLSSVRSPARVLTRTPTTVTYTHTPHTPFSSRFTKMGAVPPSSFEASIKRNPHPDFKSVESSRPPFDTTSSFRYTQTPQPTWTPGSGANTSSLPSSPHISISPSAPGRAPGSNYKLLISAVVPRPIAFVSTLSQDGTVANLAPFSYFQLVAHDPPMFVIGFASPLDAAKSKDTLRNLAATGECVINIISESYVEAANATSVNAPPDVSEWDVAGLTAVYDCEGVRCARVGEAVFSVECRLDSLREFDSRAKPGTKSGTLAVVEGTRFWVREDAVDEGVTMVDPAVLRPVSRLGGITYGRTTEAFELPRPDFEKDIGGRAAVEALKRKKEGAETSQ